MRALNRITRILSKPQLLFNLVRLSLPPNRIWLLNYVLQFLQVIVALVGLTYSVENGKTYTDTYIEKGIINAANLSSYFNKGIPLATVDLQALAHTYGELTTNGQECEQYDELGHIYKSQVDSPYFCRRAEGKQEFVYRFKEYNPNDIERHYPYFTNRTVTASSGACFKYDALSRIDTVPDLNGYMSAAKYHFANSTYQSDITIPMSSEGASATVYVYRGPERPDLAQVNSCGNRCLWMWAHRTSLLFQNSSTFFQCPISISEVKNATSVAHDISDSMARIAAASIALQGRWAGDIHNKVWTQYQFHAIQYTQPFHLPRTFHVERETH